MFNGRLEKIVAELVEKNNLIDGRLDVIGKYIVELKERIEEVKQESVDAKQISKKVSEQHNEFHGEMLEKLNKAGELIVGYETFFENTLMELEEVISFVDILAKRPALSNDPDYANFARAIQLMVHVIEKYSSVADNLKKENKVNKTD